MNLEQQAINTIEAARREGREQEQERVLALADLLFDEKQARSLRRLVESGTTPAQYQAMREAINPKQAPDNVVPFPETEEQDHE